jgi:hypothetical protein
MQYYNVAGTDFVPMCANGGKDNPTPNGCFKKINCGRFSFPVNLPNGSIVKYLEMFFIRHDTSMVLNYNYLNLMKFDPGVASSPYLIDIQDSGQVGPEVQRRKSNEQSELIDNQNFFYQFLYEAASLSDVEFCGARIYYYPPSSSSYLPLIKNQ